MLISTFIIYDLADVVNLQTVDNSSDLIQTVEINEETLQSFSSFADKIFKLHSRFCVTLDLSAKPSNGNIAYLNQFIDACLLLCFHYRYVCFRFLEPFIVLKGDSETIAAGIPVITQRFKSQGFAGVQFNFIESSHPETVLGDGGKSHLLFAGDDLSQQYKNLLQKSQNMRNLLFVKVNKSADIEFVIKEMLAAETRFKDQMPQIYELMHQVKELHDSHHNIAFQNSLLQERLESELRYRSFYNTPDTGYKKQIKEITDFYNTEYEILPLWYKRLGHIIKVLTGKRTFKSLLNDNVKKYKT